MSPQGRPKGEYRNAKHEGSSVNGTAVAVPGARRAALALHALAPADRAWLLGRLDAAERDRVRALLAELDALGVRFDPADIDALTDLADAPADAAVPAPAPDDWHALLPDEPGWVLAALGPEPGLFGPAARQALQVAAQRRRSARPLPQRVERSSMPAPVAPRRWFDGVRRWMR